MTGAARPSPFLSRVERFAVAGSTNDIVRDWLAAGTPEVCLAIAAEQTAGRGREGRTWIAPVGCALLLSLGFRPTWLAPERTWRLVAVGALAMAEAAESVVGLPAGRIRLKWPNDLVIDDAGLGVRKVAGLLGETDGLGTADPRVVVGIGINTDWPAEAFPPPLAGSMTSLREVAGDRLVDQAALEDAFLERLEAGIDALRAGDFDGSGWAARQVTTGRTIRLERPDAAADPVRATGVDPETGALLIEGGGAVVVGEISHVRLGDADPVASGV